MSRPIKEGDTVTVYWYDRDGQTRLQGTVRHTPAATGDLLYIEDRHGKIHGINTTASNFERIVKDKD